jgi:hypothetical protein
VTAIQHDYPSAHISDAHLLSPCQKVPDKIVQLFFSYLKPDEIHTVAQVCRTWRTLASDFAWSVFSLSLPNFPQLQRPLFQQGRSIAYYSDFYDYYSSLHANLEGNRYVLRRENYPKEATYVHFSQHGFCFVHLGVIEIYNPCSRDIATFFLLPEYGVSNTVCALALSDLYLAIGYSSGSVDIWDFQIHTKLSTIKNTGVPHLELIDHDLFLFDRVSGGLWIYNIQKKEAIQQLPFPYFKFFQKLDSTHLLGVDAEGTFYLWQHNSGNPVMYDVIPLGFIPVAVCIDEEVQEKKRLFIGAKITGDDGEESFGLYTLTIAQGFFPHCEQIGPIPFTQALFFKHGYLWNVQQNGEISKINPLTYKTSTVLSRELQEPLNTQSAAFWSKETFNVYFFGKGMFALDFRATSREMVADIAFGQENPDLLPFQHHRRLECLTPDEREGILFCLRLHQTNRSEDPTREEIWSQEQLCEAMKFYVENYLLASTPDGRKVLQKQYEMRENLKCNHFVVQREGYPQKATYVHFSENAFCFVHPGGMLEIHNPRNRDLPALFCLTQFKENNPISCLALSNRYLAIGYASGTVEIMDCQTGRTLSTINDVKVSHLDFLDHDLFLFDKIKGELRRYNMQEKVCQQLRIPKLQFFQKLDRRNLLGVTKNTALYLWYQDHEGGAIHCVKRGAKLDAVAACIDEQGDRFFFVAKIKNGENFLLHTIANQGPYRKLYIQSYRQIGSIPPSHSLFFKHGYLWNVQQNGKMSKIDLITGTSTVLSLQEPLNTKVSPIWVDEKLYIYTPSEEVIALDFCATERENKRRRLQ